MTQTPPLDTGRLIERLRATTEIKEWCCDWPGCDDGYEGNRYCRKCHGEPIKPAETVLVNPVGPEAADLIESLLTALDTDRVRLEEAERVIAPFAKVGQIIGGSFGPALWKDDDAFEGRAKWNDDGGSDCLRYRDFRAAASFIQSGGGG